MKGLTAYTDTKSSFYIQITKPTICSSTNRRDIFKLNLRPFFRTIYQETGLVVRIETVISPRLLEGANLDDSAPPGSIVFIRRSKKSKFVCVKCCEGWVAISDIYYHNKKVMKPIDFYNGLLSRPGAHKFIND